MEHLLKFALLLVVLGYASTIVNASSSKHSFEQCETIVKKWELASLDLNAKEDKHVLQDLLFFLHIPRTGGRTYFHCFLKKLYASSLECPRSYDKLRFNPSKTNCRLLVNHDDYSMMSKLPQEKTSVVTILRNPVDRVFSTYEFSIEVAARFLVHRNLTSATQMAARLRAKTKGISTLDIWPWKYLVPWMRKDLFARREAKKHRNTAYVNGNDPYNMEDVVMPLHEYINNPIARDIIHNGATFQVAGLTNNSYLAEAHDVRHCVLNYQTLGAYVLKVAKKRLDDMLYVGLTEDHRDSATMFANVVGAQVISQLTSSSSSSEPATNDISEQRPSFSDSKFDNTHDSNISIIAKGASKTFSPENIESRNGSMTVGKLMEAYESCISGLRNSQAQRRTASLKRISPANFTKRARLLVPDEVLQEIKSFNSLDVELYDYAQAIFSKQHTRMSQNLFNVERVELKINNRFNVPSSEVIWLGASTVLLLFLVALFVNVRRRTSKVKI